MYLTVGITHENLGLQIFTSATIVRLPSIVILLVAIYICFTTAERYRIFIDARTLYKANTGPDQPKGPLGPGQGPRA